MSVTASLPLPAHPFRELAGLVRQVAPQRAPDARRPTWLAPAAGVVAAGLLTALLISHGESFVAALERALRANWGLVVAGGVLEAASVAGYVLLLHRVVSGTSSRLSWRDSCDITLTGTAATRLLPTAGLGGVAVTVWALRAHGVRSRELAERMLAFLVLLYSVFMAALIACGAAVGLGVVHVPHGRGLGLVAAALGLAVVSVVILAMVSPSTLRRALGRAATGSGRVARAAARAEAGLPALRAALTRAVRELRGAHPALIGAVAWWAFDIAVLFAMLHAFGEQPHVVVLVLAYFLGTMFNVLPVPGSLSGGLAGVLVALGTPAGAAIAAVLAYRTVAVWLPAGSGLLSAGRLRASAARWRREALAPA